VVGATLEGEDKYHYIFENLYDAAFLIDVEKGIIRETNLQGTVLLNRRLMKVYVWHHVQLHSPEEG